MAIPRKVTAWLDERYIFNFRMPPDALARHLPVTWLQPETINGWSVTSFCILSLEQVTLWPLPGKLIGFKTISCAYRCGIVDVSTGERVPSVYILDRNTDLPLIARLGPFLFLDTLPMVRVAINHVSDTTAEVRVRALDQQRIFSADVHHLGEQRPFVSQVFSSIDEFGGFLRGGVSSWTPSIFGDALARVDLHKDEPTYEPLDAHVDFDWLESAWRDVNLEFDSAVRARGGHYRWTYRGVKEDV
jgi:hypothetical protein